MNQAAAAGANRADELRLRSAFIVASVGEWIYRFALPLLVLELTGSALSTSIMYVVEFVPYIVIGLFAGNVADRADRRRLLTYCNVASAIIVAFIAVIAASASPPVLLLFAVGLVLASVRPFYFPAFQGFLVERVAPARRSVVNAWVQGTDSALNLLGPAVGVGVVIWMGPAVACAVNGMCFLVSALLISSMGRGESERKAWWPSGVWTNLRSDFAFGLHVLVSSRPLLWGTVLMTVTNLALLTVEANLAYIVAGPDVSGGAGLGAVFAGQGAGALLVASLVPRLMRRFPVGRLLIAGMLLLAVAMVLPALRLGTPMIVGAWVVAGGATSLIVIPWFTYRQEIVAADVIGRVTSVSRAISYITMPAGAVIGSAIITGLGPAYVFVVAACIQTAVWVGIMVSPLAQAALQPASAGDEISDQPEAAAAQTSADA